MMSSERGLKSVYLSVPVWTIGWMFTLGYHGVSLSFWNFIGYGLLWPYFLGLGLAQ